MKIKKKIVCVDLDETIANLSKRIFELDPTLYLGEGENYEERSKHLTQVCLDNPTVFRDLEPIEDAIEGVNILMQYYDVHFLSSPFYNLPQSYGDKRIWLEKYFGEKAKEKLTLTHFKNLFIGDYLIDDSLRRGVDSFIGEHIHFGTDKFPNWKSVIKYLVTDNYDIINQECEKQINIAEWSINLAKCLIGGDLTPVEGMELGPKINIIQ